MTEYRVIMVKKLDVTLLVAADSAQAAIDAAFDHPDLPGSICHQCASEANEGDWDTGLDLVEEVLP
ncbi:hypothetical protein GS941_20930 [Rhodococcus hoagii]|nr:hypothetical protein [Prescottella equi]